MDDVKRGIVTRWRLSNHRLKIEVLRYKRPKIERNERVCDVCGVLDDESHAIFNCVKFDDIRAKFVDVLVRLDCVQKFLNPPMCDKENVATFLCEIEKILK